MLTTELHVTFSLVWTLVIANILGAAVLMLGANQIARITFVQGTLIIPAVVLFVFMGAWMNSNAMGDWIALIVFGFLGYLMKQGGLPRPPVILGFILGPIMENALFITNQAYGPTGWMLRPVCLVLLCLVGGTVVFSLYMRRRKRDRPSSFATGKTVDGDPIVSLVLVLLMITTFVYATSRAFGWHIDAAMFPLAIGVPGIALALLALFQDAHTVHGMLAGSRLFFAWRNTTSTLEDLPAVGTFFLWLLGVLGATVIAGQRVALPLFIVLARQQNLWVDLGSGKAPSV